jgi:hypothetical protein
MILRLNDQGTSIYGHVIKVPSVSPPATQRSIASNIRSEATVGEAPDAALGVTRMESLPSTRNAAPQSRQLRTENFILRIL